MYRKKVLVSVFLSMNGAAYLRDFQYDILHLIIYHRLQNQTMLRALSEWAYK